LLTAVVWGGWLTLLAWMLWYLVDFAFT